MSFEQVSEFCACTVERLHVSTNSCSKAFSNFCTLALHSFYGLALMCCRAMGVETVHRHEFFIFLHVRLGLTLNAYQVGRGSLFPP